MLGTHDMGTMEGCILLYLRQAFDSLRWDYMFCALARFGIPEEYIAWVRLLYTNPTARARTGRHISGQYTVARGTRQGCPLSPLLFILVLEPLLHRLRTVAACRGITRRRTFHTVSAYADDRILYIKDMSADSHPMPSIFESFQSLSGLAINAAKSYAYFFDSAGRSGHFLFGPWAFQIAPDTFKYLGIQIYRNAPDLLDGNLGCAITAIKSQIQFWVSLPLSVAGRVVITKMVLLQRLLYFFTNLPLLVPLRSFKVLNSLVMDLIWGTGRRHIGLAKLQLHAKQGGMGVPGCVRFATLASCNGWRTGLQDAICTSWI